VVAPTLRLAVEEPLGGMHCLQVVPVLATRESLIPVCTLFVTQSFVCYRINAPSDRVVGLRLIEAHAVLPYLEHPKGMLGITLTNLIPSVRPSKDELPPAGIDTTRSMFWVSCVW
jgi:hypothetical protein